MIRSIFLLLTCLIIISCSSNTKKVSTVKEKNLDLQVQEAYLAGMKALDDGDVLFAAQKFNEVEILYPQSTFAPKSLLMAAYSYYSDDYYEDCIEELERFLRVYPKDKNLDYAYYLLAISYYEQIVDEKKDLFSILKAQEYFEYITFKYPNTEFALDSIFKLELIDDILAAKEMYLGRYYVEKKKWIPAINRFKNIVENYETTIYIEEALYRLVEVHYLLGLKEESKKYAKLLGYNYRSSRWYENSYSLFDKKYKKINLDRSKKSKKNQNILSKIKSILNLDE